MTLSVARYLQHLLPNSITCKFRVFYVYRQIPLLADSNRVTFTAKLHYLQIPTSGKNLILPSKSNTRKFQDNWFTANIHYLHITLLTNSYNPV